MFKSFSLQHMVIFWFKCHKKMTQCWPFNFVMIITPAKTCLNNNIIIARIGQSEVMLCLQFCQNCYVIYSQHTISNNQ